MKEIVYNKKSGQLYLFLIFISSVLTFYSLFTNPLNTLMANFFEIQFSTQRLYVDELVKGLSNGALLNGGLIGYFCVSILLFANIYPNGLSICLVLLNIGFAFSGLSLFSTLPIVFGTWVFSKLKNERFKNYAHDALLSFGLAPIVNEIAFGSTPAFPMIYQYFMAIVIGIIIGITVPSISNGLNISKFKYLFHQKLLSIGLVSLVFYSAYNSIIVKRAKSNFIINLNYYVSSDNYVKLMVIFVCMFISILLFSWFMMGKSFKPYIEMIKKNNKVEDYTNIHSFYCLISNVAIIGLLTLIVYLILGIKFNGIVLCSLFICISLSCLKLNPIYIPIYAISYIFSIWTSTANLNSPTIILGFAFGYGLICLVEDTNILFIVLSTIVYNYINIYLDKLVFGLNLFHSGFSMALTLFVFLSLYKGIINKKDASL